MPAPETPLPPPQQPLTVLAEELRAWAPALPEVGFSGRGIVIVAGGATVFTNAYVLVSVLRKTLHCALPIEVWHFGAEEMSAAMAALLLELGVTLVDAQARVAEKGARIRDGWQLKSFALLWSSFADVLLLDADQVPVIDPAGVFDWPEYRGTGAVFWPDIHDIAPQNAAWSALGLPPGRRIALESGQLLVDKLRHWRALAVALRLNEEADRLYHMVYGDKDTFLLAWELASDRFTLVPHRPFIDERCLFQRDFAGNALFQHRTNCKWAYAGEQFDIENFQHLGACLAAIEHLRAHWCGRVFNPPDRTLEARSAEADLAAASPHEFEIDVDERFEIDLLAFNEIGAGRSHDRPNWWCEEADGGIDLVLGDNRGQRYRLRRIEDGRWEGQRLRPPVTTAALTTSTGKLPQADRAGLADALLRGAGYPKMTIADRQRLVAALQLLRRVDPGIGDRLRRLLAESGDADAGALLEAADPGAPLGTPLRDLPTLHDGYRPATHDGD